MSGVQGDEDESAGCRGIIPLPGFGAAPQALCRSTKRERFEWPKVTRNAGRFY